MDSVLKLGLDAGSTTLKITLIDDSGALLLGRYERHRADIQSTLAAMLGSAARAVEQIAPGKRIWAAVTGSGGLTVSRLLGLPFVQEVVACAAAVRSRIPRTDVAVELGGEDAKITYFRGGLEQRMNSSCAGGTGAFIDQMASLLGTDAAGLDALAARAERIHPIAARCGVFAKSDIQPLINEGARREDIAASILQAVVNQTISELACGRPIRGTVAFLGGPLHFLPQLRKLFMRTLSLAESQAVAPPDAQLYPALGAAQLAADEGAVSRPECLGISEILERARAAEGRADEEVRRLPPLFADDRELEEFRRLHDETRAPRGDLASCRGPVFLGVDGGSTTSKLALIDPAGNLLWSFYSGNGGSPLTLIAGALESLYAELPEGAWIARACSTGYGEALVREGLGADDGEVETVAHMAAAARLVPDVETVLDIGGQDMKFLRIKDGALSSVVLNEACSSGCGSFVETFAHALGHSAQEFSALALRADRPVDLGSRCTVFMNSRVKQAQKEGAGVGDIAAGLAYSVVQNALRKVIRIHSPEQLGRKIIVQGGAFASDAILRAFERAAGLSAARPDISGLMGAYGAALLAAGRWDGRSDSALISRDRLRSLSYRTESLRCAGCANACALTVNVFEIEGAVRKLVSGNRCERGARISTGAEKVPAPAKPDAGIPDLFDWKYRRLFGYESLPLEQAPRGVVGIPRVLNLYENYPFWHTFFTALGFRVELSPRSSRGLYERGLESIPSESVCYPGKLVHGHVQALKDKGVSFIFYPCAPRELRLVEGSDERYNCPVVASYPEVIRNNVEGLRSDRRLRRPTAALPLDFRAPFLPLGDERRLTDRLTEELWDKGIGIEEIKSAVRKAWVEQENYRREVREEGERALAAVERLGIRGIVLAGRPYHVDPEVNHGIPQLIHDMGMAVLTEDSVAHRGTPERPLRVLDQWAYHSRLYAAAQFVSSRDDLDLVQLNSFGCGLDAVTSDQVEEILRRTGKIYTCIKIDEQSSLGAARIRLRSLAAALRVREASGRRVRAPDPLPQTPVFTEEMRRTYTILAPQMSPLHFRLLEPAFRLSGCNLVLLPDAGHEALDEGQRSVNNDACYPSILVVGQLMAALKSGNYDVHRTALLLTQTGGACRASNYVGFLRKALEDSGLGHIPVISLNAAGLKGNPGFRVSWPLLKRGLMALVYGDVLMRTLYRVRPYEAAPGSAVALVEEWSRVCEESLTRPSFRRFGRVVTRMVRAFDALPLRDIPRKPRIGVVGEILVKFHPGANNDIVGILEREGAEVVVPDLTDFFFYCAYNSIYRRRFLDGSLRNAVLSRAAIAGLEVFRVSQKRALARSARFAPPESIYRLARGLDGIVQLGNAAGEGWFLAAEMAELAREGADGIACVQPFACLPNHITGKGAIQELRRRYPGTTVSAVDYDPGASEVNQLNRIKLLAAAARERRASKEGSGERGAPILPPQDGPDGFETVRAG